MILTVEEIDQKVLDWEWLDKPLHKTINVNGFVRPKYLPDTISVRVSAHGDIVKSVRTIALTDSCCLSGPLTITKDI